MRYRPVSYDVEHMSEITFWIHAVQFACTAQAVQQRTTLTTELGAEEQADGMTLYNHFIIGALLEVIMLQNSPSVYVSLDVHKESLAVSFYADAQQVDALSAFPLSPPQRHTVLRSVSEFLPPGLTGCECEHRGSCDGREPRRRLPLSVHYGLAR